MIRRWKVDVALTFVCQRYFDVNVDRKTLIRRRQGNEDSTLTSQRRIDVGCSTLIKRCGHNLKKTLMQFTISTSFFNVYSTSLSENFNVDSTLIQRWINVVCPLGWFHLNWVGRKGVMNWKAYALRGNGAVSLCERAQNLHRSVPLSILFVHVRLG